jgi:hypothetical protein
MAIRIEDVTGMDFSDVAGPERIGTVTPGDVLREDFMIPLGLSARALAREINVPSNRITAQDYDPGRGGLSRATPPETVPRPEPPASPPCPRRSAAPAGPAWYSPCIGTPSPHRPRLGIDATSRLEW